MRLTQKKIEDILKNIVGEEGLPLIKQLYARQNVSEFELATKTKKDIKIVRKLLYTLYNHNLVGFTRKKDKIKGWYIYYWTLLPESVRYNYLKTKKEQLAQQQHQLEEENKEIFFSCPGRCVRLNFDHASEFEFHCPECGELVSQEDGKVRVAEIKKRIEELENDISAATEQKRAKRVQAKARKKTVKAKTKQASKAKKTKKRKK